MLHSVGHQVNATQGTESRSGDRGPGEHQLSPGLGERHKLGQIYGRMHPYYIVRFP